MANNLVLTGNIVSSTSGVTIDLTEPPTINQVITATSATEASWQTPTAGSGVTGNALTSYVAGNGSRNLDNFGDLTSGTPNDPITLDTNTLVLITLRGGLTSVSENGNPKMTVQISGATTVAAGNRYQISARPSEGGHVFTIGSTFVAQVNAGSNTFTIKYDGSPFNTYTYSLRTLSVIPLN